MLKIGDFAQLAQVSVRALRIYAEMGLLKPVHVNKSSGYRHYETEQLPRLNRIIALKDLGFSLEQISRVVKSDLSAEQLRGMLVLKQSEIERNLKEGQSQLIRVEARLRQIEREGKVSRYEVTVKEIRLVTIASSRSSLATLDEITRVPCGLYTDLYQWLDENHIEAGEPEMAIYDNAAYVETNINMEAAITVGEKVSLNRHRPQRGSRLGGGEGGVALFPTALVFGELRLKTNSLWPAFIAHNITNAISAQLIIEGFVKFKPNADFIFSPNTDGIIMMILFWAVGLWMLKRRTHMSTKI